MVNLTQNVIYGAAGYPGRKAKGRCKNSDLLLYVHTTQQNSRRQAVIADLLQHRRFVYVCTQVLRPNG